MDNLPNTNIYKIVCNITGSYYLGSTSRSIMIRLMEHCKDYLQYLKGKMNYISSFKILEQGDFKIELLESLYCIDKKAKLIREQYWIDRLIDCVNIKRAYATEEQDNEYRKNYRINNYSPEYRKKYYETNKEHVDKINKLYRDTHKEQKNARSKQLYQEKRLIILEKQKAYIQLNKEKVLANARKSYAKRKELKII